MGNKTSNSIDVLVFDTYDAANSQLGKYLDANLNAHDELCSGITTALESRSRDAQHSAGNGLEFKCLIKLYDSGREYGFCIGVHSAEEQSCEMYRSIAMLAKAVKKELPKFCAAFTCYGAGFSPLFYTVREEIKLSDEDRANIANLPDMVKEEIELDDDLSRAKKKGVVRLAKTIAKAFLAAPPERGLTDKEIERFKRVF